MRVHIAASDFFTVVLTLVIGAVPLKDMPEPLRELYFVAVLILGGAILCTLILERRAREAILGQERANSERRMVEQFRAVLRDDQLEDSRNKLIVETVRVADEINFYILGVERRTQMRFREELGQQPYPDEPVRAIIEEENARAVKDFNKDFIGNLRSVVEPATKYDYVSVDPFAIEIAKNGAKTTTDIHVAFAALDDLFRQLVHGAY